MALKRPDSISFSKKNVVRPFEDASSLDFWSQKNDASLFVVGQSTKKRPDGMVFVRMFDYRVLDMCEVGIENYKAMNEFKDQLDATEKEKVEKLVAELRQLAVKGQAGESDVTADSIREKISETQQASLGLFQKVYEKRNAENNTSEAKEENTEKKD